jgi:hypothetical protein
VVKPDRPRRIDVKLDAVITTAEGNSFAVLVLDLSAQGFRVEVDDHLIVGEHISLKVRTREAAEAVIKWTLGHEAGGQFLGGIPATS